MEEKEKKPEEKETRIPLFFFFLGCSNQHNKQGRPSSLRQARPTQPQPRQVITTTLQTQPYMKHTPSLAHQDLKRWWCVQRRTHRAAAAEDSRNRARARASLT
jgi:hypothetical protein